MEPPNDPLCHNNSVLSRCSYSVSLIVGCQGNNIADILSFHDRGWDQTGSNGASMYFLVPFLTIFGLLTSPKTYPFHWNLVSVLQEDNRTTSVIAGWWVLSIPLLILDRHACKRQFLSSYS